MPVSNATHKYVYHVSKGTESYIKTRNNSRENIVAITERNVYFYESQIGNNKTNNVLNINFTRLKLFSLTYKYNS